MGGVADLQFMACCANTILIPGSRGSPAEIFHYRDSDCHLSAGGLMVWLMSAASVSAVQNCTDVSYWTQQRLGLAANDRRKWITCLSVWFNKVFQRALRWIWCQKMYGRAASLKTTSSNTPWSFHASLRKWVSESFFSFRGKRKQVSWINSCICNAIAVHVSQLTFKNNPN